MPCKTGLQLSNRKRKRKSEFHFPLRKMKVGQCLVQVSSCETEKSSIGRIDRFQNEVTARPRKMKIADEEEIK